MTLLHQPMRLVQVEKVLSRDAAGNLTVGTQHPSLPGLNEKGPSGSLTVFLKISVNVSILCLF